MSDELIFEAEAGVKIVQRFDGEPNEYELVMPSGNRNIWFTDREAAIYCAQVVGSCWLEAEACGAQEARSAVTPSDDARVAASDILALIERRAGFLGSFRVEAQMHVKTAGDLAAPFCHDSFAIYTTDDAGDGLGGLIQEGRTFAEAITGYAAPSGNDLCENCDHPRGHHWGGGCQKCHPGSHGCTCRVFEERGTAMRAPGALVGNSGSYDGEVCDGCGARIGEIVGSFWSAPNDLWNLVEGGEGGLKCPACFTSDCSKIGIHIGWVPDVYASSHPDVPDPDRELSDGTDERPHVYVCSDHNPDEVRCFYELPEALVREFWPDGDEGTIAQALADRIATPGPTEREGNK